MKTPCRASDTQKKLPAIPTSYAAYRRTSCIHGAVGWIHGGYLSKIFIFTDPTAIDVALTVAAAGWITAELLRLYHRSDEKAVADAMLALTRGSIPMVESINGEVFVGKTVPAKFEMLLLLAHATPKGTNRTALGNTAKCSQPSVSTALKALGSDRLVHLGADQCYYITSNGEQTLSHWLMSGR